MKRLIYFPVILFGCYQTPEIKDFNIGSWNAEISCDRGRIDQATILINNSSVLLSSNQNEITNLLGDPDEHELYSRNEKFFYYDLSRKCDSVAVKRLSLRFDALGRLKELAIVQQE